MKKIILYIIIILTSVACSTVAEINNLKQPVIVVSILKISFKDTTNNCFSIVLRDGGGFIHEYTNKSLIVYHIGSHNEKGDTIR